MNYSYKNIAKIAYPIFLTLLVQNLIQMINTAFLGRVGSVELGASALGGIYYIVIFMLAFGFSTGSQILIGRRNGEGNYRQIGEIVVQGAVFLLLLAVLMVGFTRLFSEQILSVIRSEAVRHATIEYLDYRIYGLFFSCVNVLFRAFYVGTTRTLPLTLNAAIMAVVNVIADYLLIFGNFGFPAMGIAGAGLASVIAEGCSVCFFIIYTLKAVDLSKYGFDRVQFKNLKTFLLNLNISSSLMLQNVISLSTWFIFFIMIDNYLGELPLAVSNIIRSVYMMMAISVFALAATCNTLVSNLIGSGGTERVMLLIRRVATISFGVTMVIIVIIALFPTQTLGIYTPDIELINLSMSPLYTILFMLPLVSIANIYFSAVSGTGNTRIALCVELITLAVYLFYTWLLIVPLNAPLALCWTNEGIYSIVILSLSYLYLRKGKWREKRI
ncbi:MAG: MATE family efflux transporter [Prevotellaceae bacterium]|nr:MATE family efflux transporter [Prevotellaceae bacterium]